MPSCTYKAMATPVLYEIESQSNEAAPIYGDREMLVDLGNVIRIAAADRITKREVKPGSDLERIRRAINRVPQIKSRSDIDRSGKDVEISLGDVKLRLDFQTGRFKVI